jgi:hypothetical protein
MNHDGSRPGDRARVDLVPRIYQRAADEVEDRRDVIQDASLQIAIEINSLLLFWIIPV